MDIYWIISLYFREILFCEYEIHLTFHIYQTKQISLNSGVTHKSTVARTVMCRQDGRGRFPVLLDDHSKCRTNSQRKSQLS